MDILICDAFFIITSMSYGNPQLNIYMGLEYSNNSTIKPFTSFYKNIKYLK